MKIAHRQIKWTGALFLIALLANLVGNFLSNLLIENFDKDIVKKIREDSSTVRKIGSYKEHNFIYNKLGGRNDSLDFQIKILGEKKILTVTGIAVKVDDQWSIRGQKNSISEIN